MFQQVLFYWNSRYLFLISNVGWTWLHYVVHLMDFSIHKMLHVVESFHQDYLIFSAINFLKLFLLLQTKRVANAHKVVKMPILMPPMRNPDLIADVWGHCKWASYFGGCLEREYKRLLVHSTANMAKQQGC